MSTEENNTAHLKFRRLSGASQVFEFGVSDDFFDLQKKVATGFQIPFPCCYNCWRFANGYVKDTWCGDPRCCTVVSFVLKDAVLDESSWKDWSQWTSLERPPGFEEGILVLQQSLDICVVCRFQESATGAKCYQGGTSLALFKERPTNGELEQMSGKEIWKPHGHDERKATSSLESDKRVLVSTSFDYQGKAILQTHILFDFSGDLMFVIIMQAVEGGLLVKGKVIPATLNRLAISSFFFGMPKPRTEYINPECTLPVNNIQALSDTILSAEIAKVERLSCGVSWLRTGLGKPDVRLEIARLGQVHRRSNRVLGFEKRIRSVSRSEIVKELKEHLPVDDIVTLGRCFQIPLQFPDVW